MKAAKLSGLGIFHKNESLALSVKPHQPRIVFGNWYR